MMFSFSLLVQLTTSRIGGCVGAHNVLNVSKQHNNKRLPQLHVLLSIMCAADSHLHVWGDGKDPFSYAEGQDPPERLQQSSGPETLLVEMDKAGVGGALIVQVWMNHQPKSCRC